MAGSRSSKPAPCATRTRSTRSSKSWPTSRSPRLPTSRSATPSPTALASMRARPRFPAATRALPRRAIRSFASSSCAPSPRPCPRSFRAASRSGHGLCRRRWRPPPWSVSSIRCSRASTGTATSVCRRTSLTPCSARPSRISPDRSWCTRSADGWRSAPCSVWGRGLAATTDAGRHRRPRPFLGSPWAPGFCASAGSGST